MRIAGKIFRQYLIRVKYISSNALSLDFSMILNVIQIEK